ncbi:MAG TPA: hypothetical protein VG097_11340 [Gemmata sp.]|nr:hypothetical protein [Gemmata sp.]
MARLNTDMIQTKFRGTMQSFSEFHESLANQAAGNIYKKNSVTGKDSPKPLPVTAPVTAPAPITKPNGRHIGLIIKLVGDLYHVLLATGDVDPNIKNPLLQSLHLFSQRLEEAETRGLDQRLQGANHVVKHSPAPATI